MLNELQCKECGASPRGMKLCHDMFDDLLGIKYRSDGEAYRLAVACYTFQHPESHSGAAWWFAYFYLDALYHQNLSSPDAREIAHKRYGEEQTQLPQDSPLLANRPKWSTDIADFTANVLASPDEAALYWAHSIIKDAKGLIPTEQS